MTSAAKAILMWKESDTNLSFGEWLSKNSIITDCPRLSKRLKKGTFAERKAARIAARSHT